MAGLELEALREHPLTGVGRAALATPDSTEVLPELARFEDAIRSYSLNRAGVDWALVEQLGSTLAAQRCDLKIYGYLVLAAFYRASSEEGESPFLALAAALHALGDVIEAGWERCVPKVAARRQNWFKWISEELTAPVKARTPKKSEAAAFAACVAEADRAAELSGNALGLGYPLFRELRETLTALAPALPPPPPVAPPPPPPPPPKPVKPVEAEVVAPVVPVLPVMPPPVSAPAVVTPPEPQTLSRDALEDSLAATVTVLAAQLRSDSLSDPDSYWLLRALRWARHDLLRPERTAEVIANQHKTELPLPADYKAQSQQIPAWLQAGQHTEVITECEELFATYPLWLDLQRWVAAALSAIGAATAQQVISAQVQLLLTRCPEIVRFRFGDRDNTPFADAETVAWLQSQASGTGDGVTQPVTIADAPPRLPEGLVPGVQFLQAALTQARSARQRFDLQLQLGELLLAHQRSDIAMPVVESLLEAIEMHHLLSWQPELCERALRLAVKTARAAELEPPRRAVLWRRLCQLSPTDALQLGPEI